MALTSDSTARDAPDQWLREGIDRYGGPVHRAAASILASGSEAMTLDVFRDLSSGPAEGADLDSAIRAAFTRACGDLSPQPSSRRLKQAGRVLEREMGAPAPHWLRASLFAAAPAPALVPAPAPAPVRPFLVPSEPVTASTWLPPATPTRPAPAPLVAAAEPVAVGRGGAGGRWTPVAGTAPARSATLDTHTAPDGRRRAWIAAAAILVPAAAVAIALLIGRDDAQVQPAASAPAGIATGGADARLNWRSERRNAAAEHRFLQARAVTAESAFATAARVRGEAVQEALAVAPATALVAAAPVPSAPVASAPVASAPVAEPPAPAPAPAEPEDPPGRVAP